jgi:hypothetical protein
MPFVAWSSVLRNFKEGVHKEKVVQRAHALRGLVKRAARFLGGGAQRISALSGLIEQC